VAVYGISFSPEDEPPVGSSRRTGSAVSTFCSPFAKVVCQFSIQLSQTLGPIADSPKLIDVVLQKCLCKSSADTNANSIGEVASPFAPPARGEGDDFRQCVLVIERLAGNHEPAVHSIEDTFYKHVGSSPRGDRHSDVLSSEASQQSIKYCRAGYFGLEYHPPRKQFRTIDRWNIR
jgi:hypothetical protein